MGEVIHVSGDGVNLATLLNEVQSIFTKIGLWEHRLNDLLDSGNIADMVRASLPVFGCRMTVVDYDLQMLASCSPEPDGSFTVIDGGDVSDPVPIDIMSQFTTQRVKSLSARIPYFIENDSVGRCYCINVFHGETYAGSCSLVESDERPFRDSDYDLFQTFASFVQRKIASSENQLGYMTASFRLVFEHLLSSFPVSLHDVQRAMELKELSLGRNDLSTCGWFCLVARSARGTKVLTERFLCETFERAHPLAVALPFESSIVVFCLVAEDEDYHEVVNTSLGPLVSNLHLKAGISRVFEDIFRARDYYLQASCALETGIDKKAKGVCHFFESNVFNYMIISSCGEFDPKMIVEPKLIELARKSEAGVDYVETLKAYLDNECNATKTARQLFIHRSTLDDRIRRIEKYVSLETPNDRLYLRMCLALDCDDWARRSNIADRDQ